MGKGKGSGWKNIAGNDSHRHSLASKGIKSAQNIPSFLKKYEMEHQKKKDALLKSVQELDKAFEDMKKAGEEEEQKRWEQKFKEVNNPSFDAQTLFKQLGGNKFRAMTGAKNFLKGGNFLQFDIPKAKDGINRVKITLNSKDLYDMEFGMVRTMKGVPKYFPKGEQTDLYWDMLQESFTERTGLYTSL